MLAASAALTAAYLIGGVPVAWLLARAVKGVDLRVVGSGNIGATNVSRLFGKPWNVLVFLACFLLDAAKGYFPALLMGPALEGGPLGWLGRSTLILLVGTAAIVGHIYTPFLRFHGGKGVSTSLGVFFAAAPLAMFAALGAGLAAMAATRYVSVGSVVMGVVLPAAVIYQSRGRLGEEAVLCILATAVGAFIIFKHRSNLARLLRGEERRLFGSTTKHRPSPQDGSDQAIKRP